MSDPVRNLEAEMDEQEQMNLFSPKPYDLKGMVRSNDHATSVAAAQGIKERLTELQTKVLEAFRKYGPMTDGELKALPEFKDCSYSTPMKRRSELFQKGCLDPVGVRQSLGHKKMTVWNLTGKGNPYEDEFDAFIHTPSGRRLAYNFIRQAIGMHTHGNHTEILCEYLVKKLGHEFPEPYWYRRMIEFVESKAPELKGVLTWEKKSNE